MYHQKLKKAHKWERNIKYLNKSSIIKEVYKDEVFDVVKYFEGNSYNWYNIIYEEGKTGWIASGKENSWVKVENKERCSNGK